jgi:hypothetical protein
MGSVTMIFRTKNNHLYTKVMVTDNFSQRYCNYATDWMVWGSNPNKSKRFYSSSKLS